MRQEDKFSRIVELMSAAAESELTAPQAAELDSLLDTPQLRRMFAEAEDGGDAAARLERYRAYSHEAAFDDFRRLTRRDRRRTLYRRYAAAGAAAALLVFVSVAGLRMMRRADTAGSGIMPATSHAMLITAADDRVELSDRDTTITAAHSSVVIRGGEIFFNAPQGGQDDVSAHTHNRVVVPCGGIYTVWLADGTKVMLNADSELAFPSAFAVDARTVTLRGEGYFEVAADNGRPFVIHTGDDLDIRVLGTKFNVRAYGDIPQTHVTLLEGSVGVSHGQSEVVLVPGLQAVFDRGSGTLSGRPVADAGAAAAWTRGWFDFEAAPLDVIVKTLEKWYDVRITAGNADLDALGIFSLRMSHRGAIEPILDMLQDITGLRHRIEERTIYLFF